MIIATAGHVDHGKTSLIKQLTGVDTDRLEEEKRRGLSINLGFAYLKLADHSPIGFIDVPGHQRFINTMIAGVSGIDLGMLVVAADDGPMPQTLEHLDVLKLLGVSNYLLVISKIDSVEPSRVTQVQQQALGLLTDATDLTVPVFPISNTRGDGVAELKLHLENLARAAPVQQASGYFRLSVDRAFNLKGAGLVVTGTATAGATSAGDSLTLLPQNVKVRVRSIHVQDEAADTAAAGQRCALNIVGAIERDAISRGNWLVHTQAGPATARVDARLQLLANLGFPLKHLSPVKLYIGARRVGGKIFLLSKTAGANKMAPGESALVQLLLDEEISCCHGERFLLRDDSESVTLGGGQVLDPYAPKSRKSQAQRLQHLQALEGGSAAAVLQELLLQQAQLIDFTRFRQSWNLRDDEVQHLWGDDVRCFIVDGREWLVGQPRWQQARDLLLQFLQDWHQQHPREQGIKVPQLQVLLAATIEEALFGNIVRELLGSGEVVLRDGALQVAGHQVEVSAESTRQWQRLEQFLQGRGRDIPLLSQIIEAIGCNEKSLAPLLRSAVKEGRLHRLTDNRYSLPATLRELADIVQQMDTAAEPITVIAFKGHMGTGRKVAIEVLEYFDSVRYTQRRGDVRVVLNSALPAELFNR